MKSVLTKKLELNDIYLDCKIQDKLILFLQLLFKWNKKFSLTAVSTIEKAIDLHLIDSLSIHSFVKGNKIIDVGSGGGLPGIPLALFYPDKKFILLDSNRKKTIFLQQILIELQLKNVEVVHSRVELFQPEFLMNTILTRAFSDLSTIVLLVKHLLSSSGQILAMKSEKIKAEINSLPSDISANVYPVNIKGVNLIRNLVVLRKT